MKYQLEITTLLVPVNVHQLFEKCEWPELNSFDKEMVENYFSDLVNGIQTDEALDDWKLKLSCISVLIWEPIISVSGNMESPIRQQKKKC